MHCQPTGNQRTSTPSHHNLADHRLCLSTIPNTCLLSPLPNLASPGSASHAGPSPFQIQGCASSTNGDPGRRSRLCTTDKHGNWPARQQAQRAHRRMVRTRAGGCLKEPEEGDQKNRSAQCGAALATPGYTAEIGDKPGSKPHAKGGPDSCRLSATDEGDAAAACQSLLHLRCERLTPPAATCERAVVVLLRRHFDRCPEEKESWRRRGPISDQTHVDAWRSMPRRAQKKRASALTEPVHSQSPRHRRDRSSRNGHTESTGHRDGILIRISIERASPDDLLWLVRRGTAHQNAPRRLEHNPEDSLTVQG